MMEETFIHLLGNQLKWAPLSSTCTLRIGAGETVSFCICMATVSGVLETGPLGRTNQDSDMRELAFM